MNATLQVHLVPMADPETGVWCDTCLLPSAARQTFELILGDALWGRLWTVRACEDCGSSMGEP